MNVHLKLLSLEAFFQPKMHQISFGERALPTRWGSLQRSPDTLAGLGSLVQREGVGEGIGWERKGEGR